MLKIKSSQTMNRSGPSIDMTPMIDMVFQLLIFFLLTSIFAAQPVLDLTLPAAEHARDKEENKKFHLYLNKGGKIFIDQEEVSVEDLSKALKEKMEAAGEKALLLSADEEVPFRSIVRVLDVVKGLEILNLAIVTRPIKGESK